MPIKSFELTSIDGKRYSKLGERPPQIRVDHTTNVTNVAQLSDREAEIDFRFTISYVGMGMIIIEGRIIWDGDAKAVVSQWPQNKALPNEVFNPVLGAIFANCMPSAVVLSRDLGLPPPLPPPQIQVRKDTKAPGAKDHKSFMEVA